MQRLARSFVTALLALSVPACADTQERESTAGLPSRTAGERQVRAIPSGAAKVTMRSGPEVPVVLPPGFTLYPGAKILTNTVVERRDGRHILLEFASADRPDAIMRFYRSQAIAAGVALTLTLAGSDSASIGGTMAQGGTLSVSARREGRTTKAVIAFD